MRRHPLPSRIVSLLLLSLASVALAVDTPADPPPAVDALATARGHVEAKRWPGALTELKRVNAAGDADWNNLMGYTMRKQTPPDLDGAQRHYDAALHINPKHMGALEYSGELALMKGDLATAQARLAGLAKLCSSPCEPLDDLKKSVASYKAKSGKV